MNYTTIEQSKTLLDLGLSPDTADMCYCSICYDTQGPWCNVAKTHKPDLEFNDLPCWSASALLSLIRKYTLQTISDNCILLVCETHDHCINGNSIIEVCYKMIEWLLKNKLI